MLLNVELDKIFTCREVLSIWVFNVVLDKNVFDEMEHRPFATGIHQVRFFIGEVIFLTNSAFILSGY
jgi:hypothetical protein